MPSVYQVILDAAAAERTVASLPQERDVVDPDTIRQELEWCGERRAAGEHLRAAAMFDLAGWLRHGRAAGLGIKEMAGLAGVTRQTVYDLLRDNG